MKDIVDRSMAAKLGYWNGVKAEEAIVRGHSRILHQYPQIHNRLSPSQGVRIILSSKPVSTQK